LENQRGIIGVGPGSSSAGSSKAGNTGPPETAADAADWLVELHTSKEVAPLVPKFRQWLSAKPENRLEYSRLAGIWQTVMRRYGPASHEASECPTVAAMPSFDSRMGTRVGNRSVIAFASLLAIVVVGISLRFHHQIAVRETLCRTLLEQRQTRCRLSLGSFSTDYVDNRTLDLVDGSEIVLAANSQVTLDLSDEHRDISLVRGTALFKVHKDPRAVFEVRVGNAIVTVLGTVFSVERKGENDIETVVKEGMVRVGVKDGLPSIVSAGHIAHVTASGVEVRLQRTPDDEKLSSTDRVLRLDGMTLGEAAKQFNRYNRRKILVSADIAEKRLGGLVPLNDPDAFANGLLELGIEHSDTRDDLSGVETVYLSAASPHGRARHGPGKRSGLAKP